jgi:hypothetical protein
VAGAATAPASPPGRPPAANWLAAALSPREDAPAKAGGGDRDPATEAPAEPAPELSPAVQREIEALGLEPTATAGAFVELARDVGLDQTSTSKMVELHEAAIVETSRQYWQQKTQDWDRQSRSQFGAQLNSMVDVVKPLLADSRLTTQGFRDLLGQFGLGSHPDVVRTLANWGRAIGRRRS